MMRPAAARQPGAARVRRGPAGWPRRCRAAAAAAPPGEHGGDAVLWRMTVAYDGGRYLGFQRQGGAGEGRTVQAALEAALATRFQRTPDALKLTAAGRTDTGVHARGQVVAFRAPRPARHRDREALLSLNRLLPRDVRVASLGVAPEAFHPRYLALSKRYAYECTVGDVADPFARHTAHHVFGPLDVELVRAGARHLVGTHDFTTLANASSRRRDPVKRVTRLDVHELEGGERVRFVVEGDGFLYKQVRNMVGVLLHVGRGKLAPGSIPDLLEKRDRSAMGAIKTAPAHGLTLETVFYPPDDELDAVRADVGRKWRARLDELAAEQAGRHAAPVPSA